MEIGFLLSRPIFYYTRYNIWYCGLHSVLRPLKSKNIPGTYIFCSGEQRYVFNIFVTQYERITNDIGIEIRCIDIIHRTGNNTMLLTKCIESFFCNYYYIIIKIKSKILKNSNKIYCLSLLFSLFDIDSLSKLK